MPISRPFRTLGFLPFCPESNPQTLFAIGNPAQELAVTNSSIDTTEKSMRFYWLLERLVVTIQRTGPSNSTISTTELLFTVDYAKKSIAEPYQRVCPASLISNNQSSYLISFSKGAETAIHIEAPLNAGALQDVTDESGFIGLTTVSEDWGYVFTTDPYVEYVDTTIPITFDQFTLYAKYVRPDASFTFDSITVDDYSFYEIESE
jgi:hypothetical protein